MPASPKSSEAAAPAEADGPAEATLKHAETNLRELADRVEQLVKDGLDALRAQSRTYADTAGESIGTAQKYVVEQVQERPLTSTFAALGVGVLIGLMISGGRSR